MKILLLKEYLLYCGWLPFLLAAQIKLPQGLQALQEFCSHGSFKVISAPAMEGRLSYTGSLCEAFGMDDVDFAIHNIQQIQASLQKCAPTTREARIRLAEGIACIRNFNKVASIGPCLEEAPLTVCFSKPGNLPKTYEFRKSSMNLKEGVNTDSSSLESDKSTCSSSDEDNNRNKAGRVGSHFHPHDHSAIAKPHFEKPIRWDRKRPQDDHKYVPWYPKKPRN